MYKPVVLVILDGWGISNNSRGNAIKKATKPTIEKINKYYPRISLQASGISVGIPWGEPGNSEVGHITLGAGKIIYQNLPRITLSVQDGSFFKNDALLSGIKKVKENNSSLHLMGLLGKGAVHSYTEHLDALIEFARLQKVKNVFIHIFTDGRDSPPKSGVNTIKVLQDKLARVGIGKIATVCGRNWAMDRNNNWDRIEKAYRMLTENKGERTEDPIEYLQKSYENNVTDEYIEPGVITENGKPVTTIRDGDAVIFFNFREDRARQLTKAFSLPGFDKFKRGKKLDLQFITMTEYEKDLPVAVAYPPEKISNGLGEILSKGGKKQLRITETEKYAHVTYFFNGGKEEPWPEEDRILVPSPVVPKFDQSPEMSANEITKKVIEAIEINRYDFILMNYANADMVGHTGNEAATVKAVEAIDKNLNLLIQSVLGVGGCLLITADHGNAEEITNLNTGEIDTEHSANPVPLWFISPDNHKRGGTRAGEGVGGLLSDIAPTVLDLLEVKKPGEMTGESLLPILK